MDIIEEVNQLTYLGSEICKDRGSDAVVDCRISKAKEALEILSPIWRNSLKVRIFKSNVVSVFMYGSSTYKATKSITTKLQAFMNRCLRSIFHNTISNVNLLKMPDMQQIDVIIKRQKLSCIRHSLRTDESSVARQAMQWHPLDVLGEEWECKDLNKTSSDMKQLAQSRVRWRVGVIDALCHGRDQGN